MGIFKKKQPEFDLTTVRCVFFPLQDAVGVYTADGLVGYWFPQNETGALPQPLGVPVVLDVCRAVYRSGQEQLAEKARLRRLARFRLGA